MATSTTQTGVFGVFVSSKSEVYTLYQTAGKITGCKTTTAPPVDVDIPVGEQLEVRSPGIMGQHIEIDSSGIIFMPRIAGGVECCCQYTLEDGTITKREFVPSSGGVPVESTDKVEIEYVTEVT